ncbi:hypothetical protein ACTFIY_003881 [Dictyostelium cf. discoideum]
MSELINFSPISVPCKICGKNISLSDIKEHILDECIPNLLQIYGLKNSLPSHKEYHSILEELTICRNDIKNLKEENWKNSSSSTSSLPTIPKFSLSPSTPINQTNEYLDKKEPLLVKKEDFEDSAQYFLEDKVKKQHCIRGGQRIDIFNGIYSLTICKFQHLSDIKHLGLIRQILRIPMSMDSFKEDHTKVTESGRLGKCSACGNKCTDRLKIKPSGLPISNFFVALHICYHFQIKLLLSHGKCFMMNSADDKVLKRKADDILDDDTQTNSNNVSNENETTQANIKKTRTPSTKTTTTTTSTTSTDSENKTSEKPEVDAPVKEIENNVTDDEFKSLVGLSKTNFVELYNKINSLCLNKDENRGRNPLFSLRGKLFITLVWFRHYVKDVILKVVFGLSKNTIKNYTEEIINLLYPMTPTSFNSETDDRIKQKAIYFDKYDEPLFVTSIVDGSEQRVGVAIDSETKINNFSAKKAYPSLTKLVFCSPIGKIQYLSKSRPGARNDQSMMYEVQEFLNKFDNSYEHIMGDKGFQEYDGEEEEEDEDDEDKEHEEDDEYISDEKEVNKRFKSIRIIIEIAILEKN